MPPGVASQESQPPSTETQVSEVEAEVVVDSVTEAAADVVELNFVTSDGSALPPWTPGAHIDLILGEDDTSGSTRSVEVPPNSTATRSPCCWPRTVAVGREPCIN